MSTDEFTRLFKFMEEFRSDVNTRFDAVGLRVDHGTSLIDGLSKQLVEYHQELLMMGRKVDRLERWIHQVAQEADVKLDY